MPKEQPLVHSMLRRCRWWDYCAPAIYMITMTLADRRHPLLGQVVPVLPPDVPRERLSPSDIRAKFIPSALGQAVLEAWKSIEAFHPGVKPLYLQLMEEHLHGIIQVKERLERPLGNLIGGFKSVCTKIYRGKIGNSDAILFSEGFQDTILRHRGQLMRMFEYLYDNPRRLAVRRLFPELFTIARNIAGCGGTFIGMGNLFLLNKPIFHQIQVSRREENQEQKRQEMLQAIAEGATVVSPCISPGEKLLAREAFAQGAPLITLLANGMHRLYKPSAAQFEACAEGRLLILAPAAWEYIPGHHSMSRERCCVLNELARRIAGTGGCEACYQGYVPPDMAELMRQAGFESSWQA